MHFYFDFISPYAYLAWHAVQPVAQAFERTLQPKPVLLAGILGHWGQLGPAEVPPKRRFLFKDVLRRAVEDGVPLEGPATHPFRPLCALRVALPEVCGDAQGRVIDALFHASWGRGGEIGTDEGVVQALNDAGLDGEDFVRRSRQAEIKARLRQNTEDAIRAGVFGVPTFVVDGELVFGHDRIHDLRRVLDGTDSVDGAKLEAMLARSASAHRRR